MSLRPDRVRTLRLRGEGVQTPPAPPGVPPPLLLLLAPGPPRLSRAERRGVLPTRLLFVLRRVGGLIFAVGGVPSDTGTCVARTWFGASCPDPACALALVTALASWRAVGRCEVGAMTAGVVLCAQRGTRGLRRDDTQGGGVRADEADPPVPARAGDMPAAAAVLTAAPAKAAARCVKRGETAAAAAACAAPAGDAPPDAAAV